MVDVSVNGLRKTMTCETHEEAKDMQGTLRADLREQGHGCWTMQQAIEKATQIAWGDCISGDKLIANAQEAVDFFGAATPLTHITADRIDDYTTSIQNKGLTNGTVNRKLAALSKMMTIAVKRGKLSRAPHIGRKKELERRIRFLTMEEERVALSVFDQWGKDEHSEVFCVLVDTGLRPSELWRIEARDVNFEQGVVNIWKTKNNNPRSVPMTARVKAILLRRVGTTPSTGLLFPYDNYWFSRQWQRMREHIGLGHDAGFIPYALRHTCASRLVQRGVTLLVIKEWLGHKIITTTLRYACLCPTNLMDAVKVLERSHANAAAAAVAVEAAE